MPFSVLLMLVVVMAAHLFLTYTKPGRLFYLTGENREAARLSGIPVNRYRTYAYVISGFFAALGGIVLASRIGTGQVSAGASFLMDGVAAAYIGFSVFGAGKPNVIGTLFGSILMGVLLNGLTMANVPYYAQDIIKDAILVGALALSHWQKKIMSRSLPPWIRVMGAGVILGGIHTRRSAEARLIAPLQLQQLCFYIGPASGVADEGAVFADNAMARDDDGELIRPVRLADGANRLRAADLRSDVSVCRRLAVWDAAKRRPHFFLEGRPFPFHRQIKRPAAAVKVLIQLSKRAFKQRRPALDNRMPARKRAPFFRKQFNFHDRFAVGSDV